MSGVLLALCLAGCPAYPFGDGEPRDLTDPGDPVRLTDLSYSVSDSFDRSQRFAVRGRVRDWGYLGARVDGGSWGGFLQTHRLELSAFDSSGQLDLAGGYRFPRLRLDLAATRRNPGAGRSWVLDLGLAARVSPDLELLGGVMRDSDRDGRLGRRQLDNLFVGVRYQGGERHELHAEAARFRVQTEAGVDVEGSFLGFDGITHAGRLELGWDLDLEDTRGRFGREELWADFDARLPLFGRLLFDAASHTRWQSGAGRTERSLRGGITLFARRLTLARAGEAARRTTALARRAVALGYNQPRDHDSQGRRALRESLALSPRRDELAEEILALQRAEVEERQVPQLGLVLTRDTDLLRGVRLQEYRIFLGLPWPGMWPLGGDASAVRFVRLDYVQLRRRFESGFASTSRELALSVELNRELDLLARWSRDGQTPIDVVRAFAPLRRIQLAFVYAYGR